MLYNIIVSEPSMSFSYITWLYDSDSDSCDSHMRCYAKP